MRNGPIIPALTIALLISIGACEPDEVTDVNPEAKAPGAEDLGPSRAEPVLEVEHGVHKLTFLESDDAIAVVEYAPANAPLLLKAFAAENATALEILRAVAPNMDAPAALLRAHEVSDEISAANRIPVRDLTASMEDIDVFYLDANCSYSSDHAVFRDTRLWLGWSGGWYMHKKRQGDGWQKSPTTPPRKKLWAHSCNNGDGLPANGADDYTWGVEQEPSSGCPGGNMYAVNVVPDHRAIYYQTGASKKCRFYTYAGYGSLPYHSLAIMVP